MSSSAGMLIIYVVAFIAIFYFMAIRPQQKQRRAHQQLLASLKKGDQVITAAGIYGTVKRVEENIVVLEVAKGVTMKIARRAVAEIIRDTKEARAAAPEAVDRRARAAETADASDAAATADKDAMTTETEKEAAGDADAEAATEGEKTSGANKSRLGRRKQ
ncbi:MAG: preprotein translocase subunit YajC [Thermoleophilia bacterium]|nr:preprotein translocase subunit YajC [Thermoleophilia bacterium]